VGDVVSAVALVAAGFGVCLVPASATVIHIPNVVYKRLDDLPEAARVDLSCIYLADSASPILKLFLESLRSFIM